MAEKFTVKTLGTPAARIKGLRPFDPATDPPHWRHGVAIIEGECFVIEYSNSPVLDGFKPQQDETKGSH